MNSTHRTASIAATIAATVALGGTAVLVFATGTSPGDPADHQPTAIDVSVDADQPPAPDAAEAPESPTSTPATTPVPAGSTTPTDTSADESSDESAPEFGDEEPLPGIPGQVSGKDEPTDPPPPPLVAMVATDLVAVPKPPKTEIVDLLGGGSPTPPPPNTPVAVSDFQVTPDTGIGDYAPNETGCALACVGMARLTFNTASPNVALDVRTKVPARIDVSLTNTETDEEMLFTSSGYKTKWTTSLSPLEWSTEYDLVLEAFDEDGQKQVLTHTLTTRSPLNLPGQLSDNLLGCEGECITKGVVTPTGIPAEVNIAVETNTPASLTVWLSSSEPGSVDDTPILPADAIVYDTVYIRTDWSIDVNYLDPDTTYHVIVRAEDEHGAAQYRHGEFTTDPAPPTNVRVTFEQAHVEYDGDRSFLQGDGEISLSWGLLEEPLNGTDTLGTRSEAKMHGGESYWFTENHTAWRSLAEGEKFPAVGLTVKERDRKPYATFGGWAGELYRTARSIYPSTYNVTWGFPMSVDAIKALPTCGDFGFENAPADDYCAWYGMQDFGDDYARIQLIVSFHIDT